MKTLKVVAVFLAIFSAVGMSAWAQNATDKTTKDELAKAKASAQQERKARMAHHQHDKAKAKSALDALKSDTTKK